jgi:hypothetical protein
MDGEKRPVIQAVLERMDQTGCLRKINAAFISR